MCVRVYIELHTCVSVGESMWFLEFVPVKGCHHSNLYLHFLHTSHVCKYSSDIISS